MAPGKSGQVWSGRTTGVTVATVANVDASVDIDYSELGMGTRHFEHQLVLEGEDASLPGDSGSAWLNGANEMIALNFAGGDSRRAIAIPAAAVVDALQIAIGGGVPLNIMTEKKRKRAAVKAETESRPPDIGGCQTVRCGVPSGLAMS